MDDSRPTIIPFPSCGYDAQSRNDQQDPLVCHLVTVDMQVGLQYLAHQYQA